MHDPTDTEPPAEGGEKRRVVFLSQREACDMAPVPGAAMISITDPDKPDAPLQPGWERLLRCAFYDGTYSEDIINWVKHDFELLYQSYITAEQAKALKDFLDDLAAHQVEQIFVHCYFGRSRSAAVAAYLGDTHGYAVSPAIEKPNATVLTLLNDPYHFEPLIRRYRQPAEEETAPTGWRRWWRQFFD
ncbi:dual specificity protein phosphatase family protein [Halomonas sp. LBP4]|uniref:dual specificity protein phosphatase family protein n=1 Tax=Halomonas sp. LBP4 TaxID=2044917 RepID=UPI000D774828|nr:dual specificity protein phosphatase family protein [Halomonas sp. LBP4]PXX95959.1 hypothetical protein CR157_17355 [Halomonas sp. LBP4]